MAGIEFADPARRRTPKAIGQMAANMIPNAPTIHPTMVSTEASSRTANMSGKTTAQKKEIAINAPEPGRGLVLTGTAGRVFRRDRGAVTL